MIIKASQRANGGELAVHLLNAHDNEHVTLHEMRGFISDNLKEAFEEIHAVSKLTKCKQYLFSVSLNPPAEVSVSIEDFENAAERIEKRLGLSEQPRAMLFHEKEGRLHAHCVWSRIGVEELKAVHLPFFKTRLMEIARELYLEHDWKLPRGLDGYAPEQSNYGLAEAQQAKRVERDPKELKTFFQQSWERSDSATAFKAALSDGGFALVRGDRRGFVAVDSEGEVYSLSRWCGVKSKLLKERLGDPAEYLSVDQARQRLQEQKAKQEQDTNLRRDTELRRVLSRIHARRQRMIAGHRQDRATLLEKQEQCRINEARQRASRLATGLKAVWQWMTGERGRIRKHNEREATLAISRDRDELMRQSLAQRQERRTLIRETNAQKQHLQRVLDRRFERETPSLERASKHMQGPSIQ